MVGATKRIEQELKAIKVAIAEIGKEFYRTYQGYLKALGQAMRQQSILASYHICTQGYPEAFLNLSFSQRQKMQEKLREIAKVADDELQELLQQDPEDREELAEGFGDQTPTTASLIMSLLSEENQEKQEVKSQLKDQEKAIEFDSSVLFPPETFLQGFGDQTPTNENNQNKIEVERVENHQENIIDKLDNIEKLISWQENIEKQIPEIFKTLSHQINCILQRTEILPKKIPEKVLEAATKMESGDTPVGGPPNLLNLLIEAEEKQKAKNSQITRIIAVNLRLSEIEFTDANVTAWRNKIRNLLGKLSQLQREYRKKQRERAVLEAESAWRSSWYE